MKAIRIFNCDLETLVDDADFADLSRFRWNVYAKGGYEYPVTQMDGKRVYMHRYLCGIHGLVVDHINGNTLDNRRENLRAATAAQNAQNQHATPRSNTGRNGICKTPSGHFVARVGRNNSRTYLGHFKSAEEAQMAVDAFIATDADPLTRIAQLERENATLRSRLADQLRRAA